jgi:hypothetical protein
MQKPYCPGTNCPLKDTCSRYKPNINVKKEIHFSEVPYDHIRKLCTHFIEAGKEDNLSRHIKNLENGNPN